MKNKFLLCTTIFCFWHVCLIAQQRVYVNGAPYDDNATVYIGCVTSVNVSVQVYNGSSWQGTLLDNYGPYSMPSGWTATFQPANNYNKTSVNFSSTYPSTSGQFVIPWNSPGYNGTAHINIRTTPQVYFTSTPALYGSYQSNTYTLYAATTNNVTWAGYGGIQINGSNSYVGGQSATISTQAYGGLLQATAYNDCGTSQPVSVVVGPPYIQNTTVNGSNGSSATVSYGANLYLETNGTGTGGSWAVTNGSGSINQNGLGCSAYPSNFLRIVGTASNQYGSGQDATFYIFKEGYSPYRMAYPNPTKDQITLEFEDAKLAEDLLKSIDLSDDKGRSWREFNVEEAKTSKYFQNNTSVTFFTKDIPKGTYYMQIKLGDKLYQERIIVE